MWGGPACTHVLQGLQGGVDAEAGSKGNPTLRPNVVVPKAAQGEPPGMHAHTRMHRHACYGCGQMRFHALYMYVCKYISIMRE